MPDSSDEPASASTCTACDGNEGVHHNGMDDTCQYHPQHNSHRVHRIVSTLVSVSMCHRRVGANLAATLPMRSHRSDFVSSSATACPTKQTQYSANKLVLTNRLQ